MKFAIFLRNFDEFLPEFHRNCLEITKKLTLLLKFEENRKFKLFESLEKTKRLEKV